MNRIGRRTASKIHRAVAAGLGSSLVATAVAVACPLCKDAIANDPVAAAFNSTTIFMIAVPFMLIGSVGGWLFYRHLRTRRGKMAEPAPAVWGGVWKEKESET